MYSAASLNFDALVTILVRPQFLFFDPSQRFGPTYIQNSLTSNSYCQSFDIVRMGHEPFRRHRH